MVTKLRVAARSSPLSLRQVSETFSYLPAFKYKLVPTISFGDEHKEISLLDNPPEDIFTREIDQLLLAGKADLAVHSAKDLPYPLSDELIVAALLPALDQRDALVSRSGLTLRQLPKGVRVGTSSPLRRQELLAVRPDLKIVSIRGTIADRLHKIDTQEVDAVVVAVCALKRLGLQQNSAQVLPFATHPLQGHLAVTIRKERKDLKKIFRRVDIRQTYGSVVLVGAGPGDPLLLTRKADLYLQQADIIYYDDLSGRIIENYSAEKIYVGKRKGDHSYTQTEINELLYQAVKRGKTVVRLKGGDPFIFGRGGEEVEYLQRRLINVTVVPGISAGVAAAALSLIPLSQRQCASSIAFCTGHPVEALQVPTADTLVYYMAGTILPQVAQKIITAGHSEQTPVAYISNVSLPEQTITKTTLAGLKKIKLNQPTILIVGDVVRKTNVPNIEKILFTGTKPKNPEQVIHQPLITIRPLKAYTEVDREINRQYQWIIFTSQHAVKYFFERLHRLGKDTRSLAHTRIASVGATTSATLLRYGIIPEVQPKLETAEELLKLLIQIKNKHILIPGSNLASPLLYETLRQNNRVTKLTIYKNQPTPVQKKVNLQHIDTVVFTSPSTVHNFKKIYRSAPVHLEYQVIGQTTAKALKNAKI
jgi:uroporphyrinogen III methyltransferase/synthase